MRAELLVGKLDLDGLIGTFKFNSRCHRLVSRACARRLIGFVHNNNQSTNGGANPTALLRLRHDPSTKNRRVVSDPPARFKDSFRNFASKPYGQALICGWI